MFRVFIVDDHPALREGLTSALQSEPGLIPVGAVGHPRDALPAIQTSRPDVVVLDYRLPDENGLSLCLRIKARDDPPSVLMYSAHSERDLADAALLAGSDGIIGKAASVDDLMDAIKLAARGERRSQPVEPSDADRSVAMLDAADVPILSMTRTGAAREEIANTLRLSEAELDRRIRKMLSQLQRDTLATTP